MYGACGRGDERDDDGVGCRCVETTKGGTKVGGNRAHTHTNNTLPRPLPRPSTHMRLYIYTEWWAWSGGNDGARPARKDVACFMLRCFFMTPSPTNSSFFSFHPTPPFPPSPHRARKEGKAANHELWGRRPRRAAGGGAVGGAAGWWWGRRRTGGRREGRRWKGAWEG